MRILLTNDDGIGSPGIFLLAAALREAGHRVFLVAPALDQSGVSNSITFLKNPISLCEVDADTWICRGTPADCVIAALLGGISELTKDSFPDAVISGINRGANLGTDIIFSGTAAAARQGAHFKIPSLALSLVEGPTWNWEMAIIFVVEQLEEMLSHWKPDSFLNVNIPNGAQIPSSLVHSFPALRYYNDRMEVFHAPDGDTYCFAINGKPSASFRSGADEANCFLKGDAKPEPGSDWDAIAGNNASISDVYIHPVLLGSVKGREEI